MPTTFPTDKDRYAASDSVIRQTDCQYQFGDEAAIFTIKLAGETNGVISSASEFRKGTRIVWSDFKSKFEELSGLTLSGLYTSGKVTSSTSTTKQGSAQATIVVSIPYTNKLGTGSSDDEQPRKHKVVTWNEKSTQYEFPLGAYAGEGESASDCNAGDFDAWKNEKTKNIDNYKNFRYSKQGEDEPIQLEGNTLELAKKWYKGIEAVDRAYPEVVRTSNYYNYRGDKDVADDTLIDQIEEDPELYYIDDTPDDVWSGKFPNHSWVKSAYDVQIEPTEYDKLWNMTVTESWIGIPIDERGEWDENLYGDAPDRWPFADITGQQPSPPFPDDEIPPYMTQLAYIDGTTDTAELYGTINFSDIPDAKFLGEISFGNVLNTIGNSAFEGCRNLEGLYNLSSITTIGTSAFVECSNLTAVTIPDTLTAIGENAFLSCPAKIDFESWQIDEVSAMANFPWGTDLSNITVNGESIIR